MLGQPWQDDFILTADCKANGCLGGSIKESAAISVSSSINNAASVQTTKDVAVRNLCMEILVWNVFFRVRVCQKRVFWGYKSFEISYKLNLEEKQW